MDDGDGWMMGLRECWDAGIEGLEDWKIEGLVNAGIEGLGNAGMLECWNAGIEGLEDWKVGRLEDWKHRAWSGERRAWSIEHGAESPSGMAFAPIEWTSYSIGQGFHGVNMELRSIGHGAKELKAKWEDRFNDHWPLR